MLALDNVESTDPAADIDADPFRERWVDLQIGAPYGEIGSGDREEDEAAHLLEIFLVNVIERIEILDFTGDRTTEVFRIEQRNRADAIAGFEQRLPSSIGPDAHWRNHSDSGDDDPAQTDYSL